MNHHHGCPLLLTLVLLASVPACRVPLDMGFETPSPQASPSATQAPLPTPSPIPTATAPGLATATPPHSPAEPTVVSHADYQVTNRVTLTNAGPGVADRLTLRVALIRSLEPYQELLDSQVSPSGYEVVEDEYGNQYARFEFRGLGAGESAQVDLTYQVRVYELAYDLSLCQGETLNAFLDAEENVEADDPSIQALADRLPNGQADPCQTLRALYEYVVDNITYSSYQADDHGAKWALDQGSGDCTEFADALLALSRAAGIPARFLEGVTYREGTRSELGQIKHDWLEAYLPGIGWVPLDPTWGRFPARRDSYFAGMSPDHIVVTVGRNLPTLGGYHYFYYTWAGEEIDVSHDTEWQVAIRD
jgi:transglutaminase-like putative cysteine protease